VASCAVELASVTVAFQLDNTLVRALDTIDLRVNEREFVAIVGPSGCGKTTILNMLAGLAKPSSGEVRRNGEVVSGPSRDVGYMLARAALMPWRSVRRNVEFGLQIRGVPRSDRRRRATELLKVVGLEGYASSFPAQLSHGMQQRAAVARTLAIEPSLWLMDEPFGALDAQTRESVQTEFVRLWESKPSTVLFVTHDLGEAVLLADRVIVMSARPGRITMDRRIDLPRPRDISNLRYDPEYVAIEHEIWKTLRGEHEQSASE